jgi:uncharacterized protein YdhG (YjbR/CyaY superfamily)
VANSVPEYIDQTNDGRKAMLLRLQEMVFDLQPEARSRISYGIIRYECHTGWVYLGYWSNGASVYTGYLDAQKEFHARHPSITTGKGSIRLKLRDETPWDDLREVIRAALERSAQQ